MRQSYTTASSSSSSCSSCSCSSSPPLPPLPPSSSSFFILFYYIIPRFSQQVIKTFLVLEYVCRLIALVCKFLVGCTGDIWLSTVNIPFRLRGGVCVYIFCRSLNPAIKSHLAVRHNDNPESVVLSFCCCCCCFVLFLFPAKSFATVRL